MKPVLIIDDDESSRSSYAELVRAGLGHDVVTAEGGTAALTLLRSGLRPCVIVLDLRMPGMDGFDFRRLQLADPALPECPVIICSAELDVAADLEALRAAAYLQKPVEPGVLLRLVNAFCAAGESSSP